MKGRILAALGMPMALLWALCWLWIAPSIERQLLRDANVAIAKLPTGYGKLDLQISGRHLRVSGKVRHRNQADDILLTLRQRLRSGHVLARAYNPILKVTDAITLLPYPSGWLLLGATGVQGHLWGVTANAGESRDLGLQLANAWRAQGGHLRLLLSEDANRHDECQNVDATLAHPPLPAMDALSVQASIAIIGGPWKPLPLDQNETQLKELCANSGISDGLWQNQIAATLRELKANQLRQQAIVAEQRRQATLAPAHLFLAWRDKRLLLRGEVADIEGKREWLNALIATFPGIRVIDDVRINPQRRREINLPAISASDLAAKVPEHPDDPPEGRGVLLGIAASDWKRLGELRLGTPPWTKDLPPPLRATDLLADHRMVTQWVLEESRGIPALEHGAQPAFVILTLTAEKVWISGQVADEACRAQILQAARRSYGGRAIILADQLLVRGSCQPVEELLNTLHSLPPLPRPAQPPKLAFARPGESLRSCDLRATWLQPGKISQCGLLPPDFPATLAEHSLLEIGASLRSAGLSDSSKLPTQP